MKTQGKTRGTRILKNKKKDKTLIKIKKIKHNNNNILDI